MISKKQSFVMALLLLFSVQGVWADNQRSDTLEVLFRVGQSDIDLSYANNAKRIEEFTQSVRQNFANVRPELLDLQIFTGASPEGPTELNRRLGEERGMALKKVLTERLSDVVKNVIVTNQGARWGGLYNMVEKSNEEWKFRVLTILTKAPEGDEFKRDPREEELRKLDNGRVWRDLQARYLPKLRTSGTAYVVQLPPPAGRDTIVIRDTIIYLPEPCPVYEPPIYYTKNPAIKTNLLLWGVGAPNVEFELPLGRTNHWALEGEVFWPWWTWSHNAHAEQFGNIGLELRYYLGNRMRHHTLDGWHIGLALAGGYYDFEWKRSEGYQGEYLNSYFNIGWQKRFGKNRRWAFDASLGLGWIGTKYRHYLGSTKFPVGFEEERDNHLMWQNNEYRHFFGATHANIGLAYFLGKQKFRTRYTTPVFPEPAIDDRAALKAAKDEQKAQAKLNKDREKTEKREAKAQKKHFAGDSGVTTAPEKPAKPAKAEKADKEAEKAAKAAEKAAKEQAEAAEKAAKEQAEAAEKAAKEQAKAAEKAAKEQAKAAEKAAKEQAKAAEKAAEAAAESAVDNSKEDAKAAKAAAKAAAEQAKAEEKAAAEQAKAAAKAAEKEAKEAAKNAEKQAKAAAEDAGKQAKAAAEDAAKDATKEAKARAKAEAQAAKEAAKAAAEKAKADAAAAKLADKIAESEAKARAKAGEQAAKAAAKAAAEEAKAAAEQAKEEAKAAAAAAKAEKKSNSK